MQINDIFGVKVYLEGKSPTASKWLDTSQREANLLLALSVKRALMQTSMFSGCLPPCNIAIDSIANSIIIKINAMTVKQRWIDNRGDSKVCIGHSKGSKWIKITRVATPPRNSISPPLKIKMRPTWTKPLGKLTLQILVCIEVRLRWIGLRKTPNLKVAMTFSHHKRHIT